MFVKPCEEQQTFEDFIDFVSQQGSRIATSATCSETEVRYAQTRESSDNRSSTDYILYDFLRG